MQAKKRFGQNFLNKDTIKNKIVSLLNAEKTDLIIEIGPGRGALTKYLANLDCKILCIEIDTDMHEYLDKYESDHLHIVYEDVLNFNFNELECDNLYIIGNLPYYITTPIIEHLIKNTNAKQMVFMVQKEVALRLTANPGTKDYGYMTVFTNLKYDLKYEFTVTKENFTPMPKVDSAIISLKLKNNNKIDEKYLVFLKECFAQKRKTLKNNLKNHNWQKISDVLIKNNLPDNIRAEAISNEVFSQIYQVIK